MRAISSMAFTHVYDTSHPSSSQRFWQVQLDLLQQCLLDFSPSIFAMYKSPSYFMIFQSAHSNAKFSLFLHQYKAASRQHFSWIGLIQFDWKSMDCNSTRPTLRQQLFFRFDIREPLLSNPIPLYLLSSIVIMSNVYRI
jgi:hypothetical protein